MPDPLIRDPRYRLVDAWRGVACLMVVVHHAGFALDWPDAVLPSGTSALREWIIAFLRGLELGVPLFFVISGYCIAASADANRRRSHGAREFLTRRLRRIYPPYWASLLLFVAFVATLDALGLPSWHNNGYAIRLLSPRQLDRWQWLGNLTLTETWRPHLIGPKDWLYTRVAWSLCYEEQFYAICVVLLLLAPRRLYGALAVVTLVAELIALAHWDSGRLSSIEGTFLVRWHEFAIGLAVYWRLNAPGPAWARRAVDLGVFALLLAASVGRGWVRAWSQGPSDLAFNSTTIAAAFGLALIALRPLDERAEGWAGLTPLRACGRRCYSIYLVHLPATIVVNTLFCQALGLTGFWTRLLIVVPVSSAVALAFCWVFFALVEVHFLNPPATGRRRVAGPAALAETPLAGEAG